MAKILFHTLPGQLSLFCIVFAIAMVAFLWTWFLRKSKEASED